MPEFNEILCNGCNLYRAPEYWYHHRCKMLRPCKECKKEYNRKRLPQRRILRKNWTAKNWEHVKNYKRNANLLAKYGITEEDYQRMLDAQGGRCAICSGPPQHRHLAVDHSHKTGMIRGLLCSGCNTSIGRFNDSSDLLRRAADYLDKFSTVTA